MTATPAGFQNKMRTNCEAATTPRPRWPVALRMGDSSHPMTACWSRVAELPRLSPLRRPLRRARALWPRHRRPTDGCRGSRGRGRPRTVAFATPGRRTRAVARGDRRLLRVVAGATAAALMRLSVTPPSSVTRHFPDRAAPKPMAIMRRRGLHPTGSRISGCRSSSLRARLAPAVASRSCCPRSYYRSATPRSFGPSSPTGLHASTSSLAMSCSSRMPSRRSSSYLRMVPCPRLAATTPVGSRSPRPPPSRRSSAGIRSRFWTPRSRRPFVTITRSG